MDILAWLADLIGTDPVTLVISGFMAAVCGHFLGRLSGPAYSAVAFWFLLMAGALLADDAAVALGLYPGLDVGITGGGSWEANWPMISETLPYVLVASTVGMSAAALTILGLLRLMQAPA